MCLIPSADAMYIHENVSKPHSVFAGIFTTLMCEQMDADKHFLNRRLFTDKATFHVSEMVNALNLIILGTDNSIFYKFERTSPNVNVWCGMTCYQLYPPPPFVARKQFVGALIWICLQFLPPQLQDNDYNCVIFQQDSTSPHWSLKVHDFLN
jgi:hypothetical protein